MFSVYSDDVLIYNDVTSTEEYQIINPKLELEVNTAGSFTFTIPPTSIAYTEVKRLSSIITVYRNNKQIWAGRVITETTDFWNNRSVTCEGELSFLNDTIQEPAAYFNCSIKDFLRALLVNHNKKAEYLDSSKVFYLGKVTVEGTAGGDDDIDEDDMNPETPKRNKNTIWFFETTNYETTFQCIKNKLLDQYGGYLRIRIGSNGKRYLDYLADYTTTSSQTIYFGENLLDFTRDWDLSCLKTVIIPLGSNIGEEKSTKYIENIQAYNKYLKKANGRKLLLYRGMFGNINILEYSKKSAFPTSGSPKNLYYDESANKLYGWNGLKYKQAAQYSYYTSFPSSGDNNTIYVDVTQGMIFEWDSDILSYIAICNKINKNSGPQNPSQDILYKDLSKPQVILVDDKPVVTGYDILWYDSKWYDAVYYTNRSAFPSKGDKSVAYLAKDTLYFYEWYESDYHVAYAIGRGDSVKKYNNKSAFPSTGDIRYLYVDNSTGITYVWDPNTNAYEYYSDSQPFETFTAAELVEIPVKQNSPTLPVVSDEEFPAFNAYTTVADANHKSIYVKSTKALKKYGWIEEVVNFGDISNPLTLKKKAQEYLKDNQFEKMKITITAFDLKMLNAKISSMNLLDIVRCISEPHGMDAYYPVQKISIKLDKPEDTTYTLDKEFTSVEVSSNGSVIQTRSKKTANLLAASNDDDEDDTTTTATSTASKTRSESANMIPFSKNLPLTSATIRATNTVSSSVRRLEINESEVLKEVTEQLPWDGTLEFTDNQTTVDISGNMTVREYDSVISIAKIDPLSINLEDQNRPVSSGGSSSIVPFDDDVIINKTRIYNDVESWSDLTNYTWDYILTNMTW